MNTTAVQNNRTVENNVRVKQLTEGSSVRVTVVSDKGNGKYTGIVAGVKVNLTSRNPLQIGSSFVATVSSSKGVINLIPQKIENSLNPIIINQNQEQQISTLLQSLALPDNPTIRNILLQYKQLGMAFDSSVIKKLSAMAGKIKGKEKLASEIITILKKKGIDISQEQLEKLIESFEESDFAEYKKIEKLDIDEDRSNDEFIFEQLRIFIQSIFFEEQSNKEGVLTVMNHLQGKNSGDGNWIFIPYEVKESIDVEEIVGKGNLSILLNHNNLLKIGLSYLDKDKNESKFILNFEGDSVKEIKFWEDCNETRKKMLINKLQSKFPKSEISFMEKEMTGITDSESEIIESFRREV